MSPIRSIDEEALAVRCLLGDNKSQKVLFDTFYPKVYSTAMRILSDRAAAQDALQESFLKVFNNLGQWSRSAPLGAWIRRIVIRESLRTLKSKKELPWIDGYDVAEKEVSQSGISASQVIGAAENLPSGARAVFSLYYVEGYNHKEIYELLEISISTSKTQLMRTKTLIKNQLSQKEYEQ